VGFAISYLTNGPIDDAAQERAKAAAPHPSVPEPLSPSTPPPLPRSAGPAAAKPISPPPIPHAAHRSASAPSEVEQAVAEATRLAGRERLSHDEVRGFLQEALAGKLPDRELGERDYDELADAVLELRAAQRVARGMEDSVASAETLATNREAILASLAAIERITGIASIDLGGIFPSEGGLTDERDDHPEDIVHETLPDDPAQ
jgi:hypothetical protein